MMFSSTRFDASIIAMEKYFPDFSLSISENDSVPEARWQGAVQPIQATDSLEELLDDIAKERLFCIHQNGVAIHHPDCKASHQKYSWFKKISAPYITFELEIKYWGGERHPRAFVISPTLAANGKKHTFLNGAICAYAPWQDVWNWHRHTVVDFMGHTISWLIKWMVWSQAEVWIGEEISHETTYLLRHVRLNHQCWCGSGKTYKTCHQSSDKSKLRPSVKS